jgi:hypothetical protein
MEATTPLCILAVDIKKPLQAQYLNLTKRTDVGSLALHLISRGPMIVTSHEAGYFMEQVHKYKWNAFPLLCELLQRPRDDLAIATLLAKDIAATGEAAAECWDLLGRSMPVSPNPRPEKRSE